MLIDLPDIWPPRRRARRCRFCGGVRRDNGGGHRRCCCSASPCARCTGDTPRWYTAVISGHSVCSSCVNACSGGGSYKVTALTFPTFMLTQSSACTWSQGGVGSITYAWYGNSTCSGTPTITTTTLSAQYTKRATTEDFGVIDDTGNYDIFSTGSVSLTPDCCADVNINNTLLCNCPGNNLRGCTGGQVALTFAC